MRVHLLFCHMESSTWSKTQGSAAKKLCFEARSFQCPKPTLRHTAWSKLWTCAICCCGFNVNSGSYSFFQTHLGQGLRTQTIFSAYLLSKCIFLHVHFCLPNTVWYECELSEPGVHWKWRDISSREQAGFCKMQFCNNRQVGENPVHTNRSIHKPGQTLGTGSYPKAEANPKLQDRQIKAWHWNPGEWQQLMG